MKQHSRKHTAGFSLIEVIVGIAVLGLVTVPVCASLVLSMRLNAASRSLMTAQLEASAAVETLMATGIDIADFEENADGKPERNLDGATVLIESQDGGIYYHVTVTGEDNGKTVTLETSIRAKGGGT